MKFLATISIIMVSGSGIVSAQETSSYWGCLWVDEREPAQKFLFWCDIHEESEGVIPCISVPDGDELDDTDLNPYVEIQFDQVDRFFRPREGRCPVLPKICQTHQLRSGVTKNDA